MDHHHQNVTKDRSLGYVDLHLEELAIAADSKEYHYKSTGKKVTSTHLKFGKSTLKGKLHYEAKFFPTLAPKDFKLSTSNNRILRPTNDDATDGEGDSISSSDVKVEDFSANITTRGQGNESRVKDAGCMEKGRTAEEKSDTSSSIGLPAGSGGGNNSGKGVVMSKEELVKHRKLQFSSSLLNISRRS